MQENEKEEQALEAMAKVFVDLIKSFAEDKREAKTGSKTESKENPKDDLTEELVTLSKKALEEKRSCVFMMESSGGDGCMSIVFGSQYKIIDMLANTAKEKKEFEEALKRASLNMSLSAIDDLLKNNNPFKKSEPATAS